jgi:formate hydrogenlyase subunit 4
MKLALNFVQVALLLLTAPLLRGIVAKLKARIQRRKGSPVWRPYAEIWKLLRKEQLLPRDASGIFQLGPIVAFVTTLLAAAFVPVFQNTALFGGAGDIFIFVYLFALGRFFVSLTALDPGSSFGGMGASREALVAALSEAPLLLALTALAILAKTSSIAEITAWTVGQNFFDVSAVHALALAAVAIVAVAETGRLPVDNPTTHLELTMIHEAMVLECSGPSLAFIEWSQALKLNIVAALIMALFLPWGIATRLTPAALALGLAWFVSKIGFMALLLAFVESSVAKLRMYAVPNFLQVASALAILAVIFTAVMKR